MENSNGGNTNVGSIENSIEEDIKIALDKFSDNRDIDSAILIVEKFILGNYILRGGRKNIVKDSLRYILSDYKRVLKENEELKIRNNAIKRESEAYAENMIRLDNELNLEKEKSKYEWIRQNCLSQELVNKLYIPVQKIKDIIDRIDYDIKKTKEIISKNTNIYTSDRRNDYQIVRLRAMNTKSLDIKKRLQELLESEE